MKHDIHWFLFSLTFFSVIFAGLPERSMICIGPSSTANALSIFSFFLLGLFNRVTGFMLPSESDARSLDFEFVFQRKAL